MGAKERLLRKALTGLVLYLAMAVLLLGLLTALLWGEPESGFTLLLLGGMLCLPLLILVIGWLSGSYTRGYDRYVKTLTPAQRAALDTEYTNGYRLRGAVLTSSCVVVSESLRLTAVPYRELVWMYKSRQWLFFIPVGSISFVTRDRKTALVTLGRKYDSIDTMEFMRRVQQLAPQALVGDSEQYRKLFAEDFKLLVRLAEGQKQQ